MGAPAGEHYNGAHLWNLNPGRGTEGHFAITGADLGQGAEPLRARVDVTLIDIYERRHALLGVGFVKNVGVAEWYFEPSLETLAIPALGGE